MTTWEAPQTATVNRDELIAAYNQAELAFMDARQAVREVNRTLTRACEAETSAEAAYEAFKAILVKLNKDERDAAEDALDARFRFEETT